MACHNASKLRRPLRAKELLALRSWPSVCTSTPFAPARWNAPDLTSKHDLALTTRVLDGQPAPAFQFGDTALGCDERALPVGSRPCGTDRPQRVATRTASPTVVLATALLEAPEVFGLPVTAVAAIRRLTFDMRGGRKQAKLACGRPLDGRVRRQSRGEHSALR